MVSLRQGHQGRCGGGREQKQITAQITAMAATRSMAAALGVYLHCYASPLSCCVLQVTANNFGSIHLILQVNIQTIYKKTTSRYSMKTTRNPKSQRFNCLPCRITFTVYNVPGGKSIQQFDSEPQYNLAGWKFKKNCIILLQLILLIPQYIF